MVKSLACKGIFHQFIRIGFFSLDFQNLPVKKKGCIAFIVHTKVFVEKKTLKSLRANINGVYCICLEANICKYSAIKLCF